MDVSVVGVLVFSPMYSACMYALREVRRMRPTPHPLNPTPSRSRCPALTASTILTCVVALLAGPCPADQARRYTASPRPAARPPPPLRVRARVRVCLSV